MHKIFRIQSLILAIKYRVKIAITGLFSGLFFIHLIITAYYARPYKSGESSFADYLSYYYCYPYFPIDSRMFVPPPKANYKLYVSTTIKGKVIYTELFEEVKKNYSLFSGKEFMLLSLSSACHYVEADENVIAEGVYRFKKNESFNVLKQSILAIIQKIYEEKPEGLKITLRISDINKNHSKIFVYE